MSNRLARSSLLAALVTAGLIVVLTAVGSDARAGRDTERQGESASRDTGAPNAHELPVGRRAPAVVSPPALILAPSPDRERVLFGIVLDPSGAPVPGIAFAADWAGPTASSSEITSKSNEDGIVRVVGLGGPAAIRPVDDSVAVVAFARSFGPKRLPCWVVTTSSTLSGQVEDAHRAALEAVQVSVSVSAQMLQDFPHAIQGFSLSSFDRITDSSGSFEFEAVPLAGGARVSFARDGFVSRSFEWDVKRGTRMRVELERAGARTFTGTIRDASSEPVNGARVWLGDVETRSTTGGRFSLRLANEVEGDLLATHSKFGLARIVRADELSELDAANLDLRLSAPPDTIEGVLIDSQGRPLTGWLVGLIDAGADGRGVSSIRGPLRDLETARSDAQGHFLLRGELAGRELTLVARARHGGPTALGPRATPGAAIEFRALTENVRPASTGRVVRPDGTPIPDARVTVSVRLPSAPNWIARSNEAVWTNADGAFRFERAPVGPIRIAATKSGFETATIDVGEASGLDLTLELSRLCELRIDCDAVAPDATIVEIFDARARRVEALRHATEDPTHAFLLRSGKTLRLLVPEAATSLVVRRAGGESYNVALRLNPGELTTVSL